MTSPIINSVASLLLLFNQTDPSILSVPIAHAQEIQISDLVEFYAHKYQTPVGPLRETIQCESGFDPTIQSEYTNALGKREESYGLAQINLPAHPSITKEQALDPDFALDFMAKQFSVGNQKMWTCYTNLKKSGKI